jgi:uncharacterized damage-inducible protein DinB
MIKELIKYTEVADLLYIDTFKKADVELKEAEAIFSHILNAQHIWIKRIKKEAQQFQRFDIHTVESFLKLHIENTSELNSIIPSDLDQIVHYANSDRSEYENSVNDILIHLANHSTYHRAQVATQFRINNIQPPITDYIFLKRENLI